MDDTARTLRARLERGEVTAADALPALAAAAIDAPTRPARLEACRLLGDLAGRSLGAEWEVAERAAFALLEAARLADIATDRRGVIAAMGRGFRNIWLLPFVHRRLADRDLTIALAAITAAGGLGFPALEEAVAAFLVDGVPANVRRAAISALGRMGAMTAVDRIAAAVQGDAEDAAIALRALTEIRTPRGRDAALAALAQAPEPEVQIAAVRYLAELGELDVLPTLRRLARDDDAEIRVASSMASRALKAERNRDTAERFLIALNEPDRAVRAVLARRLRTLPIADVLEHADVLLDEDANGVVQVLGELRAPEITRYLLTLGAHPTLPIPIRARAIASIEADEPWERDALVAIAVDAAADDALRAAAIQAMAAFETTIRFVERVGELATSPSAAVRGALLWGLQLARPEGDFVAAATRVVAPLIGDADPIVRRRAAYVAGNLGLADVAPALAKLLASNEPAELRVAAYVALGELGMPGVVADVVTAVRREEDPRVLGAASNALIAAAPETSSIAQLAGRAAQLLIQPDARAREAGVEIAGLLAGAVPANQLAPLAGDDAPAVRCAVAWALGKIGDPSSERALLAAYRDADPAVRERAAASLLALGTPDALAAAIGFVAGDGDAVARGELAIALHVPPAHAAVLSPAIDRALAHVHADDPAFEPLVRMKLAAFAAHAAPSSSIDVDAELTTAFPAYAQLLKLSGFATIVKSLRTAESLFHSTAHATDSDLSPPITLWMKVLENYVHAWLGPKLAGLQRDPSSLFDYVDRVIGGSWSGFQKWIEPRWQDPVEVGGAKVDIPLRSIPNAVRELQEHRRKRLDSALSITEWARMMVLFAVDHPASGFRNMFKLGGKSSEKTIALAHRLHALAAVRNLVTHRASAGPGTLAAFRRGYYSAFEDLIALA